MMAKKKSNIYDLSKLVNPSQDVEVKTTGPTDNWDSSLHGYELVLENEWEHIPYGTHIRYLRKDGAFRKGGYIKAIWRQKDSKGIDTIKMDLVNGFGTNNTSWSIYLNNIDKIWKKIDQSMEVSHNDSKLFEIKEEVEFLRAENQYIKKELQNLGNEQRKILMLIKKLHNLK